MKLDLVKDPENYVSICCGKPALNNHIEIVYFPAEVLIDYIGRCSECKDGSAFEKKHENI